MSVTDASGVDRKGHQFSPDGKLLRSFGAMGIADKTETTFNAPSDVLVALDRSIFVADGHGPKGNNRIVKFSAERKFIKEWGKNDVGPGEFKDPHALAMDSKVDSLSVTGTTIGYRRLIRRGISWLFGYNSDARAVCISICMTNCIQRIRNQAASGKVAILAGIGASIMSVALKMVT